MGYYSTMRIDFRIIDYEGLEKAFQELEEQGLITIAYFHNKTWFRIIKKDDKKIIEKKLLFLLYIDDNLSFFNTGEVVCALEYEKWYDDEHLAKFLAPYVNNGGIMEFVGEDGERWGYEFRDKKVFGLKWIKQVTELPL